MAKKPKKSLDEAKLELARRIGQCIKEYWGDAEETWDEGGVMYVQFINAIYDGVGAVEDRYDAIETFASMVQDVGDTEMRCPK
jgi:hypothetical protein